MTRTARIRCWRIERGRTRFRSQPRNRPTSRAGERFRLRDLDVAGNPDPRLDRDVELVRIPGADGIDHFASSSLPYRSMFSRVSRTSVQVVLWLMMHSRSENVLPTMVDDMSARSSQKTRASTVRLT